MVIKVRLDEFGRGRWRQLKEEFKEKSGYKVSNMINDLEREKMFNEYYQALGEYLGCKVVINGYVFNMPRVNSIEFETEEKYAWFLLRYA